MKRLTLLKSEAEWIAADIEGYWHRSGKVSVADRERLQQIYAQWPGIKPFDSMLDKKSPCSL